MTKVPFVVLKLILFNSFSMITSFQSVFLEIPLCTYCFIYMCAVLCHFSRFNFTKKGYYLRKQDFKEVQHDFKVLAPISIYTCLSSLAKLVQCSMAQWHRPPPGPTSQLRSSQSLMQLAGAEPDIRRSGSAEQRAP